MSDRTTLTGRVVRMGCLGLLWGGVVADVAIGLFSSWIAVVCAIAFGLIGLLPLHHGARQPSLLGPVVLAKAAFGAVALAQGMTGVAPFWIHAAASWDLAACVGFLLFWIQSKGDALFQLQIDVFDGIAVPPETPRRALLVSVSDDAEKSALASVREGLDRHAYAMTPMLGPSLTASADGAHDLVVVEANAGVLAPAFPVLGMLRDPSNRETFQGKDAAVIVVAKNGGYRRAMGAAIEALTRAGANVVAARMLTKPGKNQEIVTFGASLGDRPRTRRHWTLGLADKRTVDRSGDA